MPVVSSSNNRKNIRRAMCRMIGMRFFKHHPEQYTTVGSAPSPTAKKFKGNYLNQSDNHWKNAYALFTSGTLQGEFRRVVKFENADNLLTMEYAFASAPSASDQFELLDWPPSFIHDAINRAIYDGFRSFPSVVEDDTLIMLENTLEYDLSSVSPSLWLPLQVWIERTTDATVGVASGGSGSTLVDDDAGWTTNEHAGKRISIYAGTGAGDIGTVQSNTSDTITLTGTWGGPDTTSKYRLWDDRVQILDWYRVPAGQFMPEEFPTVLRLTRRYEELYGLRIRIVYIRGPDDLDSDSETTDIEQEFIIYKGLSILHDMLVGDSSVNRSAHASLAEYYDKVARQIKLDRGRVIPSRSIWVEEDLAQFYPVDDILWDR